MRLVDARSTERFVGPEDRPCQVVRVGVAGGGAASVEVIGDGLSTPEPVEVVAPAGAERTEVEVPVAAAGLEPGGTVPAQAVLTEASSHAHQQLDLPFTAAVPGWRIFMIAHFHYDPVWWNTQASYTETWEKLPRDERPWEGRKQQPAFTLIDAHLDMARRDPDYKFVLAELDYLKPYWDTFPWRRDELRQLLRDGRVELVGGTYNEPNTNLTSAESTARNAIFGIGYQRDVLGGDPATAWQLDTFGHDPQFPGLMADAGLSSSSWARGPFHQWGPSRSPGGNPAMQFASEFDWISPGGAALLTSYMPNHYSAGWDLDSAADLDEAVAQAERLFLELKDVAATRNVLLPVGSDYTPPNRWMTAIARWWNSRYTWPKFEIGLPREFFAAVRRELAARGERLSPQSRDMNPIYTGKDVSYIDTKQAQRAGEAAVSAAERFGTVAALLGARYPAEALDKAWRQLLFGAHHDGITGTESDQVYLDLLGGWRDTYELATEALEDALEHIGDRIGWTGPGTPVAVYNPLSWDRTDVVRCRFELDEPASGLELVDADGARVPFVVEDARHDPDGRLVEVTLAFVARDVPSLGYRTYGVVPAAKLPAGARWSSGPGTRIANACYEVTVDPGRGGAVSSWIDRTAGTELLAPGGLANEVLAYPEYPTHPDQGEGPWHLLPRGAATASSADRPAGEVRVERSAIGARLVVRTGVAGCSLTQTLALYDGVARVACTTDLDGFDSRDTLFRMRVAADVPGGLPLSEVGDAVIGRGSGFPDIDVAQAPYTLDNPALNWFAVGTTARIELAGSPEVDPVASRAISVAEVVAPDDGGEDEALRELVVALVRAGVTSTVSRGSGSRYGSMDTDSNLPDVRVAVGTPEENGFVGAVLDEADGAYAKEFDRQLAEHGAAAVYVPANRPLADAWQPNADLRGTLDLPVLAIAGRDAAASARAIRRLCGQLAATASCRVEQPAPLHADEGWAAERTVGVVNVGLPGFNVDVRGRLHLSLLRSCSGWPAGVWLDPPRRAAPDGSSFQFQHWTHRFEYALVGGDGDWRRLELVRAGQEHNEPLRARQLHTVTGELRAAGSFLRVHGDGVVVTAVKPAGNPMARMAGTGVTGTGTDPAAAVTVRCYASHGRPAEVRLEPFLPVVAAARTDMLEQRPAPLATAGAAVAVELEGYEIATLRLDLDSPAGGDGRQLGRRREPAQPVFGDYWLHNKGAAPIGYQPVTVRIVERAVAADGAFEIRVAVASEHTDGPVAGTVELAVPPGWRAQPARHTYHLAPGAHEVFTVTVTPAAAGPGRWFVAARLGDEHGQVHEDVVTVDVGSPDVAAGSGGHRVLYLERATRKAAVVEEPIDPGAVVAVGGELTAEVLTPRVEVAPGGRARLRLRLDNHVAGTIRGEAQLISPWGTWRATSPWTQGFAVDGGTSGTVEFEVSCPPGTPPTSSWALAKVMYFGRLLYTPSVPLLLNCEGRRQP